MGIARFGLGISRESRAGRSRQCTGLCPRKIGSAFLRGFTKDLKGVLTGVESEVIPAMHRNTTVTTVFFITLGGTNRDVSLWITMGRLRDATRNTRFAGLVDEVHDAALAEWSRNPVTVAVAQASAACGCEGTDLRRPRRASGPESVRDARKLAMWLLYEAWSFSNKEVAKEFGLKDHTAVIYSRKVVADLMASDPGFRAKAEEALANCRMAAQ